MSEIIVVDTDPKPKDAFYRLPPEAQKKVLRLLNEAMLWRGWDDGHKGPYCHAQKLVAEIAQVYEENGIFLMQYT